MFKKSAFVKISWDLINSSDAVNFLKDLSEKYFLVICTGWGKQINEEFKKRWFDIKFWPLWRETKSFEERQLARDLLEINQAELQDYFSVKWINAEVVIPVMDIWGILCHVNWDIYTLAAYNWFDELFIFTLKDRLNDKKQEYDKYPKIKIIWF